MENHVAMLNTFENYFIESDTAQKAFNNKRGNRERKLL